MVFRYWLQAHRIWYMPWKWKIFEWHAYEIEIVQLNEYRRMEEMASCAYAKTGRYIKELFSSESEAKGFIHNLEYGAK